MTKLPPRDPARTRRAMVALGPVLRRTMLQHYNDDSCIAASRLGMDLLERMGIPSEAVRVELAVFSPKFAARIEQEGRLPRDPEEREEWALEPGVHSVALGYPHDDAPGLHVVLLVDGLFLWDLSIDQANRPEHELIVNMPVVVDLDVAAFKRGRSITLRSDGALAIYQIARERNDFWRQSNNWRKDGRDAQARADLVDAMMRSYADALQDYVVAKLQ